jgi:hypothetical protein
MCDLRIEQGLAQINALLDYIGTGHKIGDVADGNIPSKPSGRSGHLI